MSQKAFISAEEHLAKLDFTIEQASEFIFANVDQASVIFDVAEQYGVTTAMLSEITNFSTEIINEYFDNNQLNSIELNYTSLLVNSDLGELETLVDFNTNTGILSNTMLNEDVRSQLDNPNLLDFFYDPVFFPDFTQNDGLYDAEELGVGHLNTISATNENIESLFYGSLINMINRLDDSELDQIKTFPDKSLEDYQILLQNSLNESPISDNRTDSQLAELVATEAANIIDPFFESSNLLVGVLDLSYLGLATA